MDRINSTVSMALLPALLFSTVMADPKEHDSCDDPATVIESVRVFDGERVLESATVVLHCDHVKKVMPAGEVYTAKPDDIRVDGTGKTLLPGLIDSHVHVFQRGQLERALDFGVTTALDMGSLSKGFVNKLKDEREQGPITDRADLRSAALWVTAPGSHGTQFGEVVTLAHPKDAEAFVDARIAEGADYIKIIYDNFKMVDRPIPTLSKATLIATVEAAHKRGKRAVVHSRDLDAYADVIEAGADGFVHAPVDSVPDSKMIRALLDQGIFVGVNLSLARPDGERLVNDPVIGPRLSEREISSLKAFRAMHREGGDDVTYATVAALHKAGVPVLAGTDVPNAGTTIGASLHLELELLVEAGLSPADALKAATSVPAQQFGLTDRGYVAHEMQADLLLVEGKPDLNIKDTRNIVTVWKAGVAHHVIE